MQKKPVLPPKIRQESAFHAFFSKKVEKNVWMRLTNAFALLYYCNLRIFFFVEPVEETDMDMMGFLEKRQCGGADLTAGARSGFFVSCTLRIPVDFEHENNFFNKK